VRLAFADITGHPVLAKDLDRYITECRRGDDAFWRRSKSRKHPTMDGTWAQDVLRGG